MTDIVRSSAVRTRFLTLDLHDSRLVDLTIRRRDDNTTHDIVARIDVLNGVHPNYSWGPAQLVFYECTFVQLDVDLDTKHVTGDAIDSIGCDDDMDFRSQIETARLQHENAPLEAYHHFRITLCPPSGTIHVFASDFAFTLIGPKA